MIRNDFHSNLSSLRRVLDCIAQDIDYDLHKALVVCADGRHLVFKQVYVESDVFQLELAGEEAVNFFDEFFDGKLETLEVEALG